MLFHGKALEVYTAAYQNIQKIDEEEDLEVGLCLSKFRKHWLCGQKYLDFEHYSGLYYCMQSQIV